MSLVCINVSELKQFIEGTGFTNRAFSQKIGRSGHYIDNILNKGAMSKTAYDFMLDCFHLPYGAFIKKPTADSPAENKLYRLNLDVQPDKVRIGLEWNGAEIYHAYAKVREDSEKGLLQSISYAAHMLYKMAEQTSMRD
jgi:hypothetical protein